MRLEILRDAEALARRAAEVIADIAPRSIALSGGESPRDTYRLLGERGTLRDALIVFVDERCVPPDHEASNFRLVRETLGEPPGLRRIRGELPPEEAAATYARELEAVLGVAPVLDLAVLGIGADGHTASLFPDAPELAAGLDPAAPDCIRLTPADGHARFSLSLPALLDSRRLFLLLFGADKAATFEAALQDGPDEALPIRAVLRRRRQPLDVYWAA